MAEVLTTKGTAAELENIIRKADKELFLISFSFIISESFIQRLNQASERGVNIHLVYGKSIREDGYEQIAKIAGVKIYFHKNLHAKIYSNENKCLIGSMNFSEASEINNTELGVLLSITNDENAFKDAIEHCKDIVKQATLELIPELSNKPKGYKPFLTKATKVETRKTEKKKEGYCIRCKIGIELNPEEPLCVDCKAKWEVYGNVDYNENFCHACGEPDEEDHITVLIPQCRDCFKWWNNFAHPRHKVN